MYEEDEDLLEDVIIENKQAIEMVEMYSNILMNMMNAFTSIISKQPQHGYENVGDPYYCYGRANHHIQFVGDKCAVAIPRGCEWFL